LREVQAAGLQDLRKVAEFGIAGLHADFHSLRHFFITSRERSGVSPKMAQILARHSDIRLTLGVHTHASLHDQTTVIQGLPGPVEAEKQASPAVRVAS